MVCKPAIMRLETSEPGSSYDEEGHREPSSPPLGCSCWRTFPGQVSMWGPFGLVEALGQVPFPLD
ncbi:hypothetical protein GGTG_08574 [Gaeumannomyces tritici R3-111a-1]|uniref:Uncharacterized protein n=1 Tax=Gaeumannomyces tritici (strain R3-111a-1) TaxID=644352 RepID=J3P4Y8_GAET3|nr:hypothetical protein GGTG_08574 [Gaeumannomyces tritici R3-111a-1]EJT74736.1 hypothetical protein GGTG_08574 [Gaeumannomyces tritici R3-111a-1]